MIPASRIHRCAFLNSLQLEKLLAQKADREHLVLNAEFVGITNSGDFCYRYQYPDANSKTGLSVDKLFVRLNDADKLEVV